MYLITWTEKDDDGQFWSNAATADTLKQAVRIYWDASEVINDVEEDEAYLPMPTVFIVDGVARQITDAEEDIFEPLGDFEEWEKTYCNQPELSI